MPPSLGAAPSLSDVGVNGLRRTVSKDATEANEDSPADFVVAKTGHSARIHLPIDALSDAQGRANIPHGSVRAGPFRIREKGQDA